MNPPTIPSHSHHIRQFLINQQDLDVDFGEHGQRQSAWIQTWQPWLNNTGPRTPEGKAKAAQNAFRGGIRPQLRMIAKALRDQNQLLDELSAEFYDSMAETVVVAALDGDLRAIQEIARVIGD